MQGTHKTQLTRIRDWRKTFETASSGKDNERATLQSASSRCKKCFHQSLQQRLTDSYGTYTLGGWGKECEKERARVHLNEYLSTEWAGKWIELHFTFTARAAIWPETTTAAVAQVISIGHTNWMDTHIHTYIHTLTLSPRMTKGTKSQGQKDLRASH